MRLPVVVVLFAVVLPLVLTGYYEIKNLEHLVKHLEDACMLATK